MRMFERIKSFISNNPSAVTVAAIVAVVTLLMVVFNREPAQVSDPGPPILSVSEGEAGKVGSLQITEEAMNLAEIDVSPAQVREVREKIAVSGLVETGGDQFAQVTPRAPGKVVKLLALVGDPVREGQVLALLESSRLAEAQAAYRQAQAKLRVHQSNLARQQELARLGEFGSDEVEQSQQKAVEAERSVQQALSSVAEEKARMAEAESSLRIAKNKVAQAEAELQVKRSLLNRAESIPEVVSLQKMERLQADVKQAEAELRVAKSRVAEGEVQVSAATGRYQAAEKEAPLARKQWQISKGALEREETIFSRGYSRSRELIDAQAALEMAEVEMEATAEQVYLLGGTPGAGSTIPLLSPITGAIQETSLTLGESVDVEHVAFTVLNLDRVWVRLALTPKDLAKVKVGNEVEFRSDSAPDKVFRGQVTSIGAAADETTRTVPVRAAIQNPDASLKTDAFVEATIVSDVRHQRLTVPESAVQEHTGRATLYVANPAQQGSFEVRHVTLGVQEQDWWEISEGLKPGEALATEGTFYLKSEALKDSLSDGCCAVEN
ncbi:MAG: efflux RND transporter periplasmic adaptor subunit [Vulcanimicrobiota bacterium]|jgi:cobalt-zinc-cadmium efflux system membrane fusion protein